MYGGVVVPLRCLDRAEEALEAYERALTSDAQDAWLSHDYGLALFLLQRYPESLQAHTRAIKLCPERIEFHLGLGDTHLPLQNYHESLAAYEYALQLDPDRLWAKEQLAKLPAEAKPGQ